MLDQFTRVAWYWYALGLVVFLSIEFYGAAFICSGFHITSVCRGKTEQKAVALSFDDGPGDNTHNLLTTLNELNVKASFFCIGKNIERQPELTKKIHETGHLLGNHSYSHDFWIDMKRSAAISQELKSTNALIKKITGKESRWFRPPYGVTTPSIARACNALGLDVMGWSLRSMDTKIHDRSRLLTRIKNKIHPGAVILLHDHVPGIELVVRELVQHLRENGYTILPLDQLTRTKAYAN